MVKRGWRVNRQDFWFSWESLRMISEYWHQISEGFTGPDTLPTSPIAQIPQSLRIASLNTTCPIKYPCWSSCMGIVTKCLDKRCMPSKLNRGHSYKNREKGPKYSVRWKYQAQIFHSMKDHWFIDSQIYFEGIVRSLRLEIQATSVAQFFEFLAYWMNNLASFELCHLKRVLFNSYRRNMGLWWTKYAVQREIHTSSSDRTQTDEIDHEANLSWNSGTMAFAGFVHSKWPRSLVFWLTPKGE